MFSLFRVLRRHHDLLYMLTLRDIRVKYKQSVMGFFWAILMPLIITSAGVIVKIGLAKMSGRSIKLDDVLGVSVKALPWAFVVSSIRFSTACLTANSNLVTKIAFPRAVFPLAAVLSQLIDFSVAAGVVVLVFIFSPVHVTASFLWVPVLLLILIAQICGMSMLLAAANLFFRDVKYIVEVFLTFAIFFTPVFYDASMFGKWAPLLLANPVAPVLDALGAVTVGHRSPDLGWTLYATGWALFLILGGPAIFQALEPKFAEAV
jgi:lipopolysaccharide transport system permease protein